MHSANPTLRVNPGGGLTPAQVVGRDDFITEIWRVLERQSVLLTAERRMGKTSVLRKMLAEPRPGACPIKRSLQGIRSPDEFVRNLIADTEAALPGVLKRSLGNRLRKAGLRSFGVSPVSVEFDPPTERSWKDVVSETFGALDSGVDATVVLLWDELPHMVANIRDREGPDVAREMLDLMRALRETHGQVRMVFSGSLGLHHVVHGLEAEDAMWVPTHDMLTMDLPPLRSDDASYLAGQLLRNEGVECDDVDRVAATIAGQVDSAPYYVHHTVDQLLKRQRTGRCATIASDLVHVVVSEALSDPLDPWQLQHYVDRIGVYYGEDEHVVKALLDIVAMAPDPPTAVAVHEQIGAMLEPPSIERIREMLDLLCKDYYLGAGPTYAFRLELLRRTWLARRPR